MPENLSWLQNLHIEAVIFDLGNVVIPVDFDRTVQAFVALGGKKAGELYHYAGQVNLFEELERGEISRKEFLARVRPELSYASDAEIVDGWNAMLHYIDYSTFEYLNKLRPRFKTYVLSNINTYHAEWIDRAMRSAESDPYRCRRTKEDSRSSERIVAFRVSRRATVPPVGFGCAAR